ncbi:MAG TPA: Gfo/Idh/MocA family oxidoreductase [Pyrinomonadaceae bacterium]|jgi:predicted dehydrogenase|nr:Gfo/Idh/MocA family oxidoreductase [Pyrinomonadaceae bacterium]
MRKLNIAMIGYGFMGRAHSNAWRQVRSFFDVPFEPVLKVICGRNESEVKKVAERFGWQKYSTSWEDVVTRSDIDVVDICSPGYTHAPITLAAAQAKKILFCEKPLANSLEEAEQMLDAARSNNCVHMICHNYRRAPAVALARQLINAGEIGNIYHYRATYLQEWLRNPEFPTRWRLDKTKAGSGALGDLFSHSSDLARYLVGEITEVSALLNTFVTQRLSPGSEEMAEVDVDDAALSIVKFENGAIGTIEATRYATGRKNFNRFEINGSAGSVAFNLERMNELEFYSDVGPDSGFKTIQVTDKAHPYIEGWWPPGHIIGYEHTFTHTVLELLNALSEQRLPVPNFEDGVKNQRILDAVERSAVSKQWESV